MKITILAVGRLKERFWKDAVAEYLKRLSAYADVDIVEVDDIDPAHGGEAAARQREAQALIKAIPAGSTTYLLAIEGTHVSSEDIAARIAERALAGSSHFTFIIGGSTGVDESVRRRCDAAISLGRITLPHNLARVVLVEQIYRAFKIIKGEPYHK